MKNFRDLKVWEKSHQLTLEVYRGTKQFPQSELYGLTSQIRRAAASIPANLAEGCGRGCDADFGRFIQMAAGSASELEYHLLLARDLGYIETHAYTQMETAVVEVKRMLTSLIQKLRTDRSS